MYATNVEIISSDDSIFSGGQPIGFDCHKHLARLNREPRNIPVTGKRFLIRFPRRFFKMDGRVVKVWAEHTRGFIRLFVCLLREVTKYLVLLVG